MNEANECSDRVMRGKSRFGRCPFLIIALLLSFLGSASNAVTIPVDLGPRDKVIGELTHFFDDFAGLAQTGQTVSLDVVFIDEKAILSQSRFVLRFDGTETTRSELTGRAWAFDADGNLLGTMDEDAALWGSRTGSSPPQWTTFAFIFNANFVPPYEIHRLHFELDFPVGGQVESSFFRVRGGKVGPHIPDFDNPFVLLACSLGALFFWKVFSSAKGRVQGGCS